MAEREKKMTITGKKDMEAMLRIPHPSTGTPAMITQEDAARITGRSKRTIQRWISAGRIEDTAARRLLEIHAHGLLTGAWDGWHARGDHLVSPDVDIVLSRQDLATAWLHVGLIHELRHRCTALERALKTVKAPRRPFMHLVLRK